MSTEQKVLFGVDTSQFARDAVAAAGGLLKNNKNLKMTIFHGIPEPDLSYLSKAPLSAEALEKHLQLWSKEEQKLIRRAKEAVIDAGFNPDMVDTIYEENCKDPVISMINLANKEGFETIALARWGARTLAQKIMGNVTYRLVSIAYNLPVWLIDPRISSQDVLVTIVGADISSRVMEHTVKYFAHLKESRFTFFHVIPPIPPQLHTSSYWDYVRELSEEERQEDMVRLRKDYSERARSIVGEGKERLIDAGVPEQNIAVKFQAQQEGIARDIITELQEGNYGILVLGRKGFKDISQFGLGSKANKLVHAAHAFMTCLVN
ncbi:MAG: universal stress protein [Deltaproteobacteria bacterium]|jgi:nucleotide-binding universal stress UspA family protein|nr:universal stress protein [Deltaproteobacteria bacterium]